MIHDEIIFKIYELAKNTNFGIISAVESDQITAIDKKKNINSREVDSVKGFVMFINNFECRDSNYFDENFFLYLEEIDLCKRIRANNGKILSINVPFIHLGGLSHGDRENIEMEKSRNWHWMWSKFYFKKKYQGYFFAFFSTFPSFLSSIIKFLFYSFTNNKLKKNIYKMRFLGLLNSYFLKKSFYRPKFFRY